MVANNFEQVRRMVCQHLHDLKLGLYPGLGRSYPHRSGLPPIYSKHQPPTPAECITVNTYAVDTDPDPEIPGAVVRVQIRVRAEHDADPLADQIADALDKSHHQVWAGIRVARCKRISTVQLGLDAAGLDERTDNYEIHTTGGQHHE